MKKLLGFLVLLAIAYVACYALIVQPSSTPEVTGLPPWNRAPRYAIEHGFVHTIFKPAVDIDRKLFPARWQFTAATVVEPFKK